MNRKRTITAGFFTSAVVGFLLSLAFIRVHAQNGPSAESAQVLQAKIDAIKASQSKSNGRSPQTIYVSEIELESYVLFHLRKDIPARIDSLDVQLTEGAVAADTKLTFAPDTTGNAVLDLLITGTHNLFVKGKLTASGKRGKFELEDVRVDGIPVPNLLVETLVTKYVKPKYPDVDLNAPFEMPWGIESLVITPGKTTIVY